MTCRLPVRAALAVGLLAQTLPAALAGAVPEPLAAPAHPALTGKERLAGKAADEQRVDNCKVPLGLRGSKPRPDACRAGVSTGAGDGR